MSTFSGYKFSDYKFAYKFDYEIYNKFSSEI